jgi:hypothetical protein|tara:strand:- start:820 stop:987 length:168 start_codon:yes stop_codon:yes gene_type:complete
MEYEVYMKLLVDKDANFLEIDTDDQSPLIKELVDNAMYDIDDVTVTECEVSKYDK